MPILDFLIGIVLCVVFYQDMKYRAVSWCFLAVLAALFVVKFVQESGLWWHVVFNMGFILVQMAAISLYVFNKYGTWNLFDRYLGLGDLLIWGVFIWAFSPLNFIVFFIGGLFFSLAVYLVFWFKKGITIPLAGLQGLFFVMLLSLKLFGLEWCGYNDYILLELIGIDRL